MTEFKWTTYEDWLKKVDFINEESTSSDTYETTTTSATISSDSNQPPPKMIDIDDSYRYTFHQGIKDFLDQKLEDLGKKIDEEDLPEGLIQLKI